jgi:carbon monoxide dehydrogenase subunit G
VDFTGRYVIPAAPDSVWAALHDPEILSACIPGSQGVTQRSPTDYEAKAVLKVGPVKASFTGKVTWTDAPVPDGHTHAGVLAGEGQGGPAGFARGTSQVLLAASGADTILTYSAKATIGGRLAQIGQRLIDATARSVADEFFAKFDAIMRERAAPAATLAPQVQAPTPRDDHRRLIRIVALAAVAVLIVAYVLFVVFPVQSQ